MQQPQHQHHQSARWLLLLSNWVIADLTQQGMIRASHTQQVRLSVCALCREQLRELHQMQEHAVEERCREALQAGMAGEPALDDRCSCQSQNIYIQFRNVHFTVGN